MKLADLSVEIVPQPEGRCNDTYPMWVGDTVYFLSDRSGEFNLFSFDRASKSIEQLTRHDDFPIEAASSGGSEIIYEQAGRLWVFDPTSKVAEPPEGGRGRRPGRDPPRMASGRQVRPRGADISPTGQRAVVEFRGEIVTVPAKKGDVRNLTRTTRRPRAVADLVARRQNSWPTSPTPRANTPFTSRSRTEKGERGRTL